MTHATTAARIGGVPQALGQLECRVDLVSHGEGQTRLFKEANFVMSPPKNPNNPLRCALYHCLNFLCSLSNLLIQMLSAPSRLACQLDAQLLVSVVEALCPKFTNPNPALARGVLICLSLRVHASPAVTPRPQSHQYCDNFTDALDLAEHR
jgi:hypothetical protein